MYSCAVCNKAFGRIANLRRHESNMHANRFREVEQSPPTTDVNIGRPCFNEIVDDDAVFEHGCIVLECETCEAYFLDQEQLDKHEKVYVHW